MGYKNLLKTREQKEHIVKQPLKFITLFTFLGIIGCSGYKPPELIEGIPVYHQEKNDKTASIRGFWGKGDLSDEYVFITLIDNQQINNADDNSLKEIPLTEGLHELRLKYMTGKITATVDLNLNVQTKQYYQVNVSYDKHWSGSPTGKGNISFWITDIKNNIVSKIVESQLCCFTQRGSVPVFIYLHK